ncbi:MAG: hypothetical protein K5643_10110 [Saccharofermentans sp.]|nr:hypothetical protein [Saccharofermentans sp.]
MEINRSDIMKQRLGKVLFFFINVLIPLAYGLLFYMLRRPGSIVTGIFTTFIPSYPLADIRSSYIFPLENHLADILWAYVLTIVLSYVLDIRRAAVTAVIFEISIEMIQLLPQIKATFDILDIVFEIIATAIAVIVILLYRRILRYEEQSNKDDQRISDPCSLCGNGDGEQQ